MNMIRCMLTAKSVPKKFWLEAVNRSTHILNRCPTFSILDMTPEEAWSGVKPSVKHFKIFGCTGHLHIFYMKRKKLDDKSFRYVFTGASEESKAFCMYDPEAMKIVIGRMLYLRKRRGGIGKKQGEQHYVMRLWRKRLVEKKPNPNEHDKVYAYSKECA